MKGVISESSVMELKLFQYYKEMQVYNVLREYQS